MRFSSPNAIVKTILSLAALICGVPLNAHADVLSAATQPTDQQLKLSEMSLRDLLESFNTDRLNAERAVKQIQDLDSLLRQVNEGLGSVPELPGDQSLAENLIIKLRTDVRGLVQPARPVSRTADAKPGDQAVVSLTQVDSRISMSDVAHDCDEVLAYVQVASSSYPNFSDVPEEYIKRYKLRLSPDPLKPVYEFNPTIEGFVHLTKFNTNPATLASQQNQILTALSQQAQTLNPTTLAKAREQFTNHIRGVLLSAKNAIETDKGQAEKAQKDASDHSQGIDHEIDRRSAGQQSAFSALYVMMALLGLMFVFAIGARIYVAKEFRATPNWSSVIDEKTIVEYGGMCFILLTLIILGNTEKLDKQALGTLLGTIAGYIFGKGVATWAAAPAGSQSPPGSGPTPATLTASETRPQT